MTVGGSLPTLTFTTSPAVTLATAPTCSTLATSGSPVGIYPITCSGAADPNYSISYVSGTLTINPLTAGLVTISQSSLTFPSTTVNMGSSSQIVTVYNNSNVSLVVTPSITGDFMISANGCAVVVAPKGQCSIFVRFVPTTSGARAGELTINYAGGTTPFVVPLSGTGAAMCSSPPLP